LFNPRPPAPPLPSPRRQVGFDVVFRRGDPCLAHDLVKVAAHRASAVLIMMTEVDNEESRQADGATRNSATIRCLLSLRNGKGKTLWAPRPESEAREWHATAAATGRRGRRKWRTCVESLANQSSHPLPSLLLVCFDGLLPPPQVIYTNGNSEGKLTASFPKNLRVVCQLSERCPFLHSAAIMDPHNRSCLFPVDLTRTINSSMFLCAAKPGLSRVIMQLYNFEVQRGRRLRASGHHATSYRTPPPTCQIYLPPCSQGKAIRARGASELRGGPVGAAGWMVGRTMAEAVAGCRWADAILVGVVDGLADR